MNEPIVIYIIMLIITLLLTRIGNKLIKDTKEKPIPLTIGLLLGILQPIGLLFSIVYILAALTYRKSDNKLTRWLEGRD